MKEKLVNIFAEALDLKELEINDDTSPENTPGWDSLAMVNIVSAIENEFGIDLSFDELQRFVSFGEVYKLLREKGGNYD